MGNEDLASIGKVLALAGFFSVMIGGFLYTVSNPGEICADILRQAMGRVAQPTTPLRFFLLSLEER